jgi:uncharacterized protein YbjT (DUF2867 family)
MLLITTPTGNTGHHLVRQLVEGGHAVRVLVRHPAKLPTDLLAHLDVVEGSLLDVDVFKRAVQGCDGLFFCIPQADDATDVIAHYHHFAHTAVQAVEGSTISRMVYLGGAGKNSPLATKAGSAAALFHAEDVLAEFADKHEIALRTLRCPVFYESALWQIQPIAHAGMMFGLLPADYPHGQVAVRDIASQAARLLLDTSWRGVEGSGLFGPADVSMAQMAGWIADAIQKPVHYQQISRAAYIGNLRNFGVSEALANAVADMFEAIASGLFDSEPRSTVGAITLPQWIHDVFAPAYAHPQTY